MTTSICEKLVNRSLQAVIATAVLATSSAVSADPPQYTIELLGPAFRIDDMNAAGTAVGRSIVADDQRGWAAGPVHPHMLLPLPTGTMSANDGCRQVLDEALACISRAASGATALERPA